MKKLNVIKSLIIVSLSSPVFAETDTDLDVRVNSLYAANRLDDAFNLLLSVPQEERSAQQWLIMGNIMMDLDKAGDAEFMYNSALNVDPKYYKAIYNLANLHLQNGQTNMAIQEYKQALKYKKDFAHAYYNLGCAYIKAGELRKAKNAFLDAIYFKPTVADFYYNLAYVYKKLNNTKSAQLYLDYYNKIVNNN